MLYKEFFINAVKNAAGFLAAFAFIAFLSVGAVWALTAAVDIVSPNDYYEFR